MVADELMTVPQAAARLGIKPVTVHSAILRGRLPYEERYGRKLVTLADLEAYQATARRGRPKKQQEAA